MSFTWFKSERNQLLPQPQAAPTLKIFERTFEQFSEWETKTDNFRRTQFAIKNHGQRWLELLQLSTMEEFRLVKCLIGQLLKM